MFHTHTSPCQFLCGPRIVKTARGVVSFAVVFGFGIAGETAVAQSLDCLSPPDGGPADSEMCNLGTLAGESASRAYGVNGDGTVVIGMSGMRAFRWVADEGMVDLGGAGWTSARGVSADGIFVVGTMNPSTSPSGDTAFRWSARDGFVNLGTLTGGSMSGAYGVNAAGTVVVGESGSNDGQRAFRWVEGGDFGGDNPQMQNLGTLDAGHYAYGRASAANGVNADGSVVVGTSTYAIDGFRAFRWVEGGDFGGDNPQMQNLGTLNDGGFFSMAYDVSADGSVVVGRSGSNDGQRAFRWVEGGTDGHSDNPQMQNLGTLTGGDDSHAMAVNADGSVVVGESQSSEGRRAFRWVEGGAFGGDNPEMQSLGTLAGGSWSVARDVSADGSVVVGSSGSSEGERAFIWRGVMEDFENLITSFPVLGNDSAVALAEQQFALGQVMGQTGLAAAGQGLLSVRGGAQHTGRNPTTVGARTTSLGALSFGRGISESVTLGAAISLQGTSLKNNAFDMDTGHGAAIWGQFSEGGRARTGLQVSGAFGYMRTDGEVARGRLLTNVVLATGRAAVETRAVQASVGYGMSRGDWLVTPSLGLAHYESTRAAYSETGGAFNASYDAMETSRTVATLGIEGTRAMGTQGRLSIGGGVEREINPERPRLTGTSDIPGLASFDIASTFTPNRTRVFGKVGYRHDLGDGMTVSGDLRVGRAVYGTTPSVGFAITYGMRF